MALAGTHDRRIAGLDGLRALAVISVVLTHYGAYEGLEGRAFLPLIHGVTGVRAFFVLSGFLITRLLIQEFKDNGRVGYGDFLARRALRIFPLYFLFLSLVSLLYLAGYWKGHPGGLVYAWLYLYNFVPQQLYDPLLAHTWSLAVEEHFYLLWPLVLLVFIRNRNALVRFTVVGALLSFASYIVFVRWLELRGAFIERWTPVAAFSLFVGCLAAQLSQFEKIGASITRFCGSRAGIVVAALMFTAPALLRWAPALAERTLPNYFAVSLQSVGIAVFLLWVAANQTSLVVGALELKPLKYIGTISYGIYIWQGFFLGVSPARLPGVAWPPDPVIGLLGIALFAPLSYHLFEKKFLAMKGRFRVSRPARTRRSPGRLPKEAVSIQVASTPRAPDEHDRVIHPRRLRVLPR